MAKSDGESFSNAPEFLKIAVDTVGATNAFIDGVEKLFDTITFFSSVNIRIFNFTKSPIFFKDSGHEFGDFIGDTLPRPEIRAKVGDNDNDPGVDAFISGNKSLLHTEGTQGHINYDIDGHNFFIGWDNPAFAHNKSNCEVSGPRAKRFRVFNQIPETGHKIHAQFAIWENNGPFSVKSLLAPGTTVIQNPHQQQASSLKLMLGI